MGWKPRTHPTLPTAAGTWDTLGAGFRPCPSMPCSSSGASTQGRALLQGGHCHQLFGKPTSGPSLSKSDFAQELHEGTPKSQRYFQTLSITKNISRFGAEVYPAVMVRPAEAPFPSPSFLPQRSGSGTEQPQSFLLLTLCCSFPNFSHQ